MRQVVTSVQSIFRSMLLKGHLASERQEVVAINPAGQPLSGTHTFYARAPEMYASPDTG
jgi:hypothetical protein